jgi:membrane-bound inhibitor of C-type lysozyme
MTTAMTPLRVAAAVASSALLMVACAELEQSAVGGGTATLVCDDAKTFTVTYADGFETAIVEADGQRAELTKVRTTLGLDPTPPLRSERGTGDTAFAARTVQIAPQTGTTGVRYSDGDNLLLSRGRQASLELAGETYSNCETPR